MVNNVPSATAPTAGSTAASHGSGKYSKDGTCVRITFRDGSKQTLPTIPKPKNVKKCKNMMEYLDFGQGKTFPHDMYLDIQQRMRIDMANMLDDVAVPWGKVPHLVRHTVLASAKAAFPVLYRFPDDWVGEMLMVKVCRNRRDTVANKKGRLREKAADVEIELNSEAEGNGEHEGQGHSGADQGEEEEGVAGEDTQEQLDDPPTDDHPNHATSNDEFGGDEEEAAVQQIDSQQADEAPAGEVESTLGDDDGEAELGAEDDDLMSTQDEVETKVQVSTKKGAGRGRKRRIEDIDSEEEPEPEPKSSSQTHAQAPSTLRASSPMPTVCAPSLPVVQATLPKTKGAPSQGKNKATTTAPKAAAKPKAAASSDATPTSSNTSNATPASSPTAPTVSTKATIAPKGPKAPTALNKAAASAAAPTPASKTLPASSKSAVAAKKPTAPKKPTAAVDKAPATSNQTITVPPKATSSTARVAPNKALAVSSDLAASLPQVSATPQKMSGKRKAQSDAAFESDTARKPEQGADEPPAKKQKENAQAKGKGKAANRSNSWARKCQEEVAQLENASANAKKKPAAAGPSRLAPSAPSSASATAAPTSNVPVINQTQPPHRPKPRAPPADASAGTTLEAKSEMVELFDLNQTARRPCRETRSTAKK